MSGMARCSDTLSGFIAHNSSPELLERDVHNIVSTRVTINEGLWGK